MALDPGTGGGYNPGKKKPKKPGLPDLTDIFAPGTQAGGGEGYWATDPFDLNLDPILQQVKGLTAKGRADAMAAAQKAQSDLEYDYGTGAGSSNPFSFLAKMAKADVEEPRNLIENMNAGNLFYSGTRQKGESDLLSNLLERRTAGETKFNRGKYDINSALSGRLQELDMQDITALSDAAGRAPGPTYHQAAAGPIGAALGGIAPNALGSIAGALAGAKLPRKKARPGRPTGLQE